MGRQIIKIAQDRDMYMEWSSVVEAPTYFGTRKEMAKYLVSDYAKGTDRRKREKQIAEQRLQRADQTGSSAYAPFGCTWGDEAGEIFMQEGFLPRANFSEFADRFLAAPKGADPDVSDLLKPFDD